jgi:hypothetical protein
VGTEHEPVLSGTVGQLEGHPVASLDVHKQLVSAHVLGIRQYIGGTFNGERSDDQVPTASELVASPPPWSRRAILYRTTRSALFRRRRGKTNSSGRGDSEASKRSSE